MIQVYLSTVVFIFGLIVGSFLNCLIYRLETGGSFLKGRSFCPSCKHKLSCPDLVPVLSFFLLKRKCRHCGEPISWQYPLVETITGIIFLLIYLELGAWDLLFCWFIAGLLVVIFVYDLKHYIIPDKIVYPAIGLAFLYQVLGAWKLGCWDFSRIYDVGLALLPSLFLLAIILLSRGKWMGMGDFKLALLMGLFLGFPWILVALFLSFFLGAAFGVFLVTSGKKQLSSEVPFGPFLVTGTFLALFWGPEILDWYQTLFLIR